MENILWTGIVRDNPEFKEWENLIREERARITIAEAGQRIVLASDKEADIDIMYPFESLEGKEMENSNDYSVVSRLVFGKKSFFFSGDISKATEKKLPEADIKSDVLKVAHHGSKTSSGDEFVKKVQPEIAVIQAGKDNSYGHPHPETLAVLEKYGIRILRTDINNDIKILCDSQFLKLR